jgi:hypothetical protein
MSRRGLRRSLDESDPAKHQNQQDRQPYCSEEEAAGPAVPPCAWRASRPHCCDVKQLMATVPGSRSRHWPRVRGPGGWQSGPVVIGTGGDMRKQLMQILTTVCGRIGWPRTRRGTILCISAQRALIRVLAGRRLGEFSGRFGRPAILPDEATPTQLWHIRLPVFEKNADDANADVIAVAQMLSLDALIVDPRAIEALKIGHEPVLAVEIDLAVLPGEKRVTDGDVTFGRSPDDDAAVQPPAGNLVTVYAKDQTGHGELMSPLHGRCNCGKLLPPELHTR